MRLLPWLAALGRADVPVRDLDSVRLLAVDAYDLIDELPRGPARAAAWNAYVVVTFADKLLEATQTRRVRAETAELAERLYRLAGAWVANARRLAAEPGATSAAPDPLPHWHTPIRSQEELAGMRETLECLRVYLAYDLSQSAGTETVAPLREQLDAIDAKIQTVDGLWIRRAPPELRGGIGTALADGLDRAYRLGQQLAVFSA